MKTTKIPENPRSSSGFIGFVTQDDHYVARSFDVAPHTEKSVLNLVLSIGAVENKAEELFSTLVEFPRWVTFTSHPQDEYRIISDSEALPEATSAYKIIPEIGIALSPKFFNEDDSNLWIAGRLNGFFTEKKARVRQGQHGYLITEDLNKVIVVTPELSESGYVSRIISEHAITKNLTEQELLNIEEERIKDEYRSKLYEDEQRAWEMEQRERIMSGKDPYTGEYKSKHSRDYYAMMYKY
jgi:hypothetical protein